MPDATPVGRVGGALGEVVDAIQATQECAGDALRTCEALTQASRDLFLSANAYTETMVSAEGKTGRSLSAAVSQGISWIVQADTQLEKGDMPGEVQGAITRSRQEAAHLALVAEWANRACSISQIQIEGLLAWLKSLDTAVREADGFRYVPMLRMPEAIRPLVKKLDVYSPLVPEMVRRAAAEGTRGNPAVNGDGSLRGACARLAAALERAVRMADELDRKVEEILREGAT